MCQKENKTKIHQDMPCEPPDSRSYGNEDGEEVWDERSVQECDNGVEVVDGQEADILESKDRVGEDEIEKGDHLRGRGAQHACEGGAVARESKRSRERANKSCAEDGPDTVRMHVLMVVSEEERRTGGEALL